MRKKKTITAKLFIVGIAAFFFLGACNVAKPEISVDETSFSFGDVVNGQIVSRDLIVQNKGSAPLVVESVTTSCGCTTAKIEPMVISPGKSANLHIEFDSGAHGPDENGDVTRQIFIASDDPQQSELLVEFQANVLAANSNSD